MMGPIEKLLQSKGIKKMLMKGLKESAKQDGIRHIEIVIRDDGEFVINTFKEPMVSISSVDKAKYDNAILKMLEHE